MSDQPRFKTAVILLLLLVLVAGAAFAVGRMTGKGESAKAAVSTDDAQSARQSADREILYWQAPMNPEEIYDSPGKSKMGMDLIPVYADETPTAGTVRIDPVTVQNMGVRTARVERGPFARTIRAVGNIVYNEETLYTVSTKISGWVEALHVDYTGRDVRKGEALLEIYSPELVSTQKEYLLAKQLLDMVEKGSSDRAIADARSVVESARQRLLYWDIDESVIDDLERTGSVVRTVPLKAPASGVVVHKNIEAGKYIKAGMDVYRIADLSTVWLQTSLYDNEIPWIKVGQRARVEMSYAPGKTYTGRVQFVYPYLDEKERHVRVRMVFPNPGYVLKPGMYANVMIDVPTRDDVLKIPERAVIRSGARNVAFVMRGEGKFQPREVELGAEGGDSEVQVLAGLEEGEEVVTSAQFLLDSESRLQEAIQKMLALGSETEREDAEASSMPDMNNTPDAADGEVDMSSMDHAPTGAAERAAVGTPEMQHESPEEPEHVHDKM